MATNTLWQQSEVMRKKMFPKWMESDFGVLSDFMTKGEQQQVNERDYKIPVELTAGGRTGHYDPQLGDMGRGNSPTGNFMLQSYYTLRHNYEFDQLQIEATENAQNAVQNPFVQCLANGLKEFELMWDKFIHGNGTAVVATASAFSNISGVTVYTMTNAFGTQRLRRGQFYTIYNNALTTIKSAGVLWATQINPTARTLTLSGIVPGAAADDQICFEGVSGANPVGPRGLQYWISSATTGTTAGIDRSQEYQIIAKSADGTTGLNVETVMLLCDRIKNDRGEVNDLMGLVALAQRAYIVSQMVALQQTFLNNGEAQAIDRLPKLKGKKFWMWGGIPHYEDIHQDATVVPYITPSNFGRAQLGKTGFFETPGKSGPDARFYQLAGASGGPAAGVWFGFVMKTDLYCLDPGATGLINNLPLGQYA